MKTLQELYSEVMNSDALKTEFLALTEPEQILAFAEKNGCTATMDEIRSFFEEKSAAAGELSEEELAQVAGGKSSECDDPSTYISNVHMKARRTIKARRVNWSGMCV